MFDTIRIAFQKRSAQVGCSGRGDHVKREPSETRRGGRSLSATLFSNHKQKHNNMAKTQNAKKQTRKAPLKSAKQKKQAKSAKKAR
jgi:hypothetical protein